MIDRFVGGATKERNELVAQHPMGRFGRSQEVAKPLSGFVPTKHHLSLVKHWPLTVDLQYINGEKARYFSHYPGWNCFHYISCLGHAIAN